MLKKITKLLIPVLFFSTILPMLPAEASGASFDYRFTKMGAGTRQTGQWEYEITDERYDFTTYESVFALTRIFNITNVNNFQFKYEIRGALNRDMLSPVYRPNRSWWAEIWYWDEFGKLPAGSYALNVMISLDNGSFRKLDSKQFRVGGSNYYDHTFEYNNVEQSGTCQNPSYHYDWMKTGKNVKGVGAYVYEMQEESASFRTDQNVYVMVKNSHIRDVDTFRIKFEVFLNGNTYVRTNEVPVLNPRCQIWAYNYSWANLGSLPKGSYELRSYIKLNNGSYRQIGSKNISVTDATYSTPGVPTRTSVSYTQRVDHDYHFGYTWTETDNNIRYDGNYRYSTTNPRSTFGVNEEVKVLTKLNDMRNIVSFRIRHELHKDGSLIEKTESAERRPNSNYWEYNFTESNFGRLDAGNYEVRVYISIEGMPWRYLDTKLFEVVGVYDDFDYGWTRVNSSNDVCYYNYNRINCPYYANYAY